MDPLSITASIITVIGTAEVAAKSLSKIMRLKGVPDLVCALNNEVSELRLTLRELEAILSGKITNASIRKYIDSGVQPHITTARLKLHALEELVENRLKKSDGSLDRIAWLRVEEKIAKLQKDLRRINQKFATVLGIITSTSISTLETRFESMHFVSEANHQATQTLVEHTERLEQAFVQMLAMQKAHEARLESIEEHVAPVSSSKSHKTYPLQGRTPANHHHYDIVPHNENTLSALRMRFLQRRKCSPYCCCACHRTTRINTPRMLQFLTGTLFIGYSNVPKLTPDCNDLKCEKSPEGFVAVNYYFLRWIVSRVLAAGIHFTDYKSPELSLRMLNVRDPRDLFFAATALNDAMTVKMLLDERKASVIDVQHGTGHSALHMATMGSHVDVIKVLLQYGAEPFLENSTQETAYDMAWSTVLCFEDTPNSEKYRVADVKSLFPSTAALEERRTFSRIHQIVCKLCPLDLETELRKSRARINERDSDGRTALQWAAGRGDASAVELLLKYGANPNTPDRIGQGPLRSSLKATEPTCLKLLIQNGADVMQVDHWEQTCLQASMYYDDPVAFGLPLIHRGINLNAKDCVGNTALLEAVRVGHSDAVDMLIDRGADVNLQDQNGNSPLSEAISRNRKSMALKLLQNSSIDTATLDNNKRTVLHVAATSAGRPMLQLLATFKLEGIDIHAQQADGMTAFDVAERRQREQKENDDEDTKIDEKWVSAFRTLMDHVVKAAQGPPPPYEPFKDEEDRYTEYATTDSPCSSVYYDAKPHLPLQLRTTRPSSLVGSMTGSPLASRPGTPLFKRAPDNTS
ncbi:Nn.00g069900.m01.CDS01 [Neocucurbitaria sp. VM-36]